MWGDNRVACRMSVDMPSQLHALIPLSVEMTSQVDASVNNLCAVSQ